MTLEETMTLRMNGPRLLRPMLLIVFLLGATGAGIELLLLGHTEKLPQLIPLALITTSVTIALAWFITRDRRLLRIFQLSMLLWLLAGPVGIVLHFRANVRVELELNPEARGMSLIRNAVRGTMPALAPGTMFELGLVGLLYTYGHPVFRGGPTGEETETDNL